MEDKVQVLPVDGGPALPIVDGEGSARAVIWPGMGAKLRSIHIVELAPGSRTVELKHPMEAVYFVEEGSAVARDTSDGSEQDAVTGAMIFVEPDTPYVISANGEGARLVGGPCPPDPALYSGLADD